MLMHHWVWKMWINLKFQAWSSPALLPRHSSESEINFVSQEIYHVYTSSLNHRHSQSILPTPRQHIRFASLRENSFFVWMHVGQDFIFKHHASCCVFIRMLLFHARRMNLEWDVFLKVWARVWGEFFSYGISSKFTKIS